MIGTLAELEAFTRRLGREDPAFGAECVLSGPGLTDAEAATLTQNLPTLPESYLRCARQFRLLGVRIAGFSLSPMSSRGSLVEALSRANSADNPAQARLSEEGLMQIGVSDSERVVVACRGSQLPEGTVLSFHLFDADEPPALLAPDFERFLLYAGNLLEISLTLTGRKAMDAFEERLAELDASVEMVDGWWEIAEEFIY